MCLIAYMPPGHKLPESHLVAAYRGNSDGIGVMHEGLAEKFVGNKALKRARKYIRRLGDAGVAHAVHFRFATHGAVTRRNCHPFRLPNNAGYLMHNGVLYDYAYLATDLDSDTSVFSQTLTDVPMGTIESEAYWKKVGSSIYTNKLCVMTLDGRFTIVNEDLGDWIDGVWYSQTYSLPWGSARKYTWSGVYGGDTGDNWYDKYKRRQDAETAFSQGDAHGRKALIAAYDRRYGTVPAGTALVPIKEHTYSGEYDDETVNDPWRAWYRDKYGNDPKADITEEERELDEALKATVLEDQFCTLCGKTDVSLDAEQCCQQCAWELLQNPELYDEELLFPNRKDASK